MYKYNLPISSRHQLQLYLIILCLTVGLNLEKCVNNTCPKNNVMSRTKWSQIRYLTFGTFLHTFSSLNVFHCTCISFELLKLAFNWITEQSPMLVLQGIINKKISVLRISR